ncbi:MAG TPA: hypothetical protein VGL23_09295 [Chloroflexota bacterium]
MPAYVSGWPWHGERLAAERAVPLVPRQALSFVRHPLGLPGCDCTFGGSFCDNFIVYVSDRPVLEDRSPHYDPPFSDCAISRYYHEAGHAHALAAPDPAGRDSWARSEEFRHA